VPNVLPLSYPELLLIQLLHSADLDAASLAAVSQCLAPREDNTVQGFQDQVINSCKQILANIDPLATAACTEAETLGKITAIFFVLNE